MSNGTEVAARALNGLVPDVHLLKMRYEDGGKTELWYTETMELRVRSGASETEIRSAFEDDLEAHPLSLAEAAKLYHDTPQGGVIFTETTE